MGAYNLYKDQHACHNEYLLNNILKGEWGFDGAVISDWGGAHDTPQAISNGLDLEFGTWTDGLGAGTVNAYDNYYLATPFVNMLNDGKADMEDLDDKARRVLRLISGQPWTIAKEMGRCALTRIMRQPAGSVTRASSFSRMTTVCFL